MSILRRNNVKVFGKGERVLMFAHGFGCDQVMWRYITPAFEENYKIVLFDYVGCGKSEIAAYDENRYTSLHGYALDIIEICEELHLSNIILVGHSVSSMIGILASIQRPDIFNSLILVCPSSCYLNKDDYSGGFDRKDLEELLQVMENNYIGWSDYLAPIVMKNSERPELTEELTNSFCSMDHQITRNFARVTFFSDNRKDLSKVRVPSLILQCSQDDIAPERVGKFINERLKESSIIFMKATGHCPHMSHPAETIQCMKDFIAQIAKPNKLQEF